MKYLQTLIVIVNNKSSKWIVNLDSKFRRSCRNLIPRIRTDRCTSIRAERKLPDKRLHSDKDSGRKFRKS